jgi:hypothetical protein
MLSSTYNTVNSSFPACQYVPQAEGITNQFLIKDAKQPYPADHQARSRLKHVPALVPTQNPNQGHLLGRHGVSACVVANNTA